MSKIIKFYVPERHKQPDEQKTAPIGKLIQFPAESSRRSA
jgi:hypothetical protein